MHGQFTVSYRRSFPTSHPSPRDLAPLHPLRAPDTTRMISALQSSRPTVVCGATKRSGAPSRSVIAPLLRDPALALAGLAAAATLALSPAAALADVRLPPLDNDPNRCERAFDGNTIGQANAVSDRALDLRFCDLAGKNLTAKTLSGALLSDADLHGTNLREVVMSKAYAVNANFSGADLTNAVVDRVAFDGANMSGTQFVNAVITGTTFKGTNLEGANFEDALIGNEDAKRLCANPTLTGESREQVGCRGK